jgi:hypothetical protein
MSLEYVIGLVGWYVYAREDVLTLRGGRGEVLRGGVVGVRPFLYGD